MSYDLFGNKQWLFGKCGTVERLHSKSVLKAIQQDLMLRFTDVLLGCLHSGLL